MESSIQRFNAFWCMQKEQFGRIKFTINLQNSTENRIGTDRFSTYDPRVDPFIREIRPNWSILFVSDPIPYVPRKKCLPLPLVTKSFSKALLGVILYGLDSNYKLCWASNIKKKNLHRIESRQVCANEIRIWHLNDVYSSSRYFDRNYKKCPKSWSGYFFITLYLTIVS